jgi:cytochrome c-type biogenesis protein CcmH/NrfG
VNQPAGREPAQPGKPAAGAKGGKAAKADIEGLIKLGTSLYSAGDYAKALGVWQRILKADPRNAAAKKNLDRTKQKLKAQKSAKG